MDIAQQRPIRLVEGTEEGGLVVLRKQKMGRFGTGLLRLFRIDPEMTIRLDAVGSDVWRLMDGRTCAEMLDTLQERHPDATDLPARLGRYVGALVGYELVSIQQG
ncbi:MAG: PqqD family protein [Thermoplasmatota archaeon]